MKARAPLPKNPAVFTHYLDGNLTQDGRWNYTWDGENRLIALQSISSIPAAHKQKFEYAYDATAAKIGSKAYDWNTGTSSFQLSTETKFLYDGWAAVSTALRNDYTSLKDASCQYCESKYCLCGSISYRLRR